MRFKQLPVHLDVQPLIEQISENSNLWNYDDSWTAGKDGSPIYAADNIVLRYNKSSRAGLNDWNKAAFKILNQAIPIVFDVIRAIPGEHLGKVMISRLLPGQKIDWHIDRMPPGMTPYFQRYQIPLSISPGVRFCVEDEEVYMEPGTAWWFDNQRMHAVFNDSDQPRISMFTDIRPFVL